MKGTRGEPGRIPALRNDKVRPSTRPPCPRGGLKLPGEDTPRDFCGAARRPWRQSCSSLPQNSSISTISLRPPVFDVVDVVPS